MEVWMTFINNFATQFNTSIISMLNMTAYMGVKLPHWPAEPIPLPATAATRPFT